MALAIAAVVGLAVGASTAYAQGWLTTGLGSLANSAGPWSLAAFLVARYARRVPVAVPAAMVALICCELGYAIATNVRGGSNATSTVTFWLIAAVIAGPPLGIAGAWSTRRGPSGGIGFGVIAGVLIGEGIYGWTTVADTTDWRYWAIETLIGVGIVVVAVRQHRLTTSRALAIAAAFATAIVVFGAARLA